MRVSQLFRSLPLNVALFVFCATVPQAAMAAPSTTAVERGTGTAASADSRLQALYNGEWAWRMANLAAPPARGRGPGVEIPISVPHLQHVDPARQELRRAYWVKALAELDTIPLDQLSPEERINAGVFRAVLEGFVAQIAYREYESPFISGGFFWDRLAPRQGFGTAQEYRDYLGRLRDIPWFVDENIANMRAGLARGFTPPRITIVGREKTLEPFTERDLSKNPLYAPFTQMPPGIPVGEQERLRAEGRRAVEQGLPAFDKLLPFIRDEYIPHARTTIAAEALPDGKNYYKEQIREYTTLSMSAEEIHRLGLDEVARIRGEMDVVMRKSGWKGEFADFLTFIKTDPQFVAKTPYELLARATYVANKVNGQLKYTLGLLPRYRFTILPTPARTAPFATGGNGGLDSCLINTFNLSARKLYMLPSLVLHECSPGHSLQAALALEAPARPAIRRYTYFSGYGEGWGLYSERLGIGMGVYETPYEDFGRLSYEMWRACRLVVDTGIHHFGWSRQQAIDYLASNTALSDFEIRGEVDRYISTPGQALAYKLGEITILRERAKAETALGPKFDQRWFHDVLLGVGPVPLPILEQVLDAWIAAGGKNPNPGVMGAGPNSSQ